MCDYQNKVRALPDGWIPIAKECSDKVFCHQRSLCVNHHVRCANQL